MKRLQVGDECYVRVVHTGNIYKVRYKGGIIDMVKRGKNFRLVYPYPIIKQLAK